MTEVLDEALGSGFGDGCYPFFRMDCDGKSCGILIDMTGLLAQEEVEGTQEETSYVVKKLPQSRSSR